MYAAKVMSAFPSSSNFKPINPELNDVQSFDVVAPRASNSVVKTTGVPSVSQIIGCTDPMENLYQWQLQMIKKHGIMGFRQHMTRRMQVGTCFHSVVELLLKELKQNGEIASTPEKVLSMKPNCDQFKAELKGYFNGLLPFLKTLKSNDNIILEGRVDHPYLYFRGRFDAIVEIDGDLTLVDWKTINKESAKSQATEAQTPQDLFSNPLQLAAYVSAVNCSSLYPELPTIKKAAIVLAYEDRDDVEVVKMDLESIQLHFDHFLTRINRFWWGVENKMEKGGVVDFLYNPVAKTINKMKTKSG
ncbi:unnamed protein product [Bursaphelenchus okinawaensis]|uniref:PD-(D/E)XK endonuclease-like domain-containing protein n=1 Tax=Bursaphelenchus okinawaensis TaxID=465554 RepID=A0A811L7G0_9BILA|nr:unnamed protein product [Bursaphelenchus okinawaensis]CAG9118351.1 unnamed protein product [Bursaphelenchus okinawaensis]